MFLSLSILFVSYHFPHISLSCNICLPTNAVVSSSSSEDDEGLNQRKHRMLNPLILFGILFSPVSFFSHDIFCAIFPGSMVFLSFSSCDSRSCDVFILIILFQLYIFALNTTNNTIANIMHYCCSLSFICTHLLQTNEEMNICSKRRADMYLGPIGMNG